MRKLALLVGLVAASAVVSSACVEKIDTDPPGGGNGGTAGSGGDGGGTTTATQEELYGSGSRLSAVYLDAGDGADVFRHFHDADLDLSCGMAEVDDGSVRCVPRATGEIRYTDAGCSTSVLLERQCGAAVPDLFSVDANEECADANVRRRDAYAKGAATTATEIYFMDAAGNCVLDTSYDETNDSVYEVSAADNSQFAEATLEQIEADGGLGQLVAKTEDGAFQVLGAYNVAREENCSARTVGDSMLCLSSNVAQTASYTASDTCDEAALVGFATTSDACGEPQAIIQYTDAADVCDPQTTTLHAVGDAVDAANVYTDAGGTCEATTETDYRYYEIGGEAMEGVVPAIVAATDGDGRLTATKLTTPDGAPVGQDGFTFMDTERDEVCRSTTTTDGVKCMPTIQTYPDTGTTFFADDQCTVQVISVPDTTCSAGPPAYIGYTEAPTNTCASTTVASVHAVGAEFTGTVYQDVLGSCTAGTFENITFYEVGAEVPLTSFVDLAEVTQAAEEAGE